MTFRPCVSVCICVCVDYCVCVCVWVWFWFLCVGLAYSSLWMHRRFTNSSPQQKEREWKKKKKKKQQQNTIKNQRESQRIVNETITGVNWVLIGPFLLAKEWFSESNRKNCPNPILSLVSSLFFYCVWCRCGCCYCCCCCCSCHVIETRKKFKNRN